MQWPRKPMPPEDAAMFRRCLFDLIELNYGWECSEAHLARFSEGQLDMLERFVALMLEYPGYALN